MIRDYVERVLNGNSLNLTELSLNLTPEQMEELAYSFEWFVDENNEMKDLVTGNPVDIIS